MPPLHSQLTGTSNKGSDPSNPSRATGGQRGNKNPAPQAASTSRATADHGRHVSSGEQGGARQPGFKVGFWRSEVQKWTDALEHTVRNILGHKAPLISEGAFAQAHHFAVNNPLMVDNLQLTVAAGPSKSWRKLQNLVLHNCEFDSFARSPPPRCYEGTSLAEITDVQNLLEETNGGQRLLWLQAPAGAGKTAIIQTVAERQFKHGGSGATLFFTDSNNLIPTGDITRFWLTIAYRLGVNEPTYREYVQNLLEIDFNLTRKDMRQQFELLIVQAFEQGSPNLFTCRPVPIFIDGLEHYFDKDQQGEVVELVARFMSDHPSAPFVWIVTSRPGGSLAQILTNIDIEKPHLKEYITRLSLQVGSPRVCNDIALFYRGRFQEIREAHQVVSSDWPVQSDTSRLLNITAGFFPIASGVTTFVDQRNPPRMLQTAFSMLVQLPTSPVSGHTHPLKTLFNLYGQILTKIPAQSSRLAQTLLGFYLLPKGFGMWTPHSTSLWTLCGILGVSGDDAYDALRDLHPLIDIPTHKDAFTKPIRFFHPSFAQYLSSTQATRPFSVDVRDVVATLWQRHFDILQQVRVENMPLPDLKKLELAWASSVDLADDIFREQFWENAKRVFFHHLLPCPAKNCTFGIHYDDLSMEDNLLSEVLRRMSFDNLVEGYLLPDLFGGGRFLAFLDSLFGGQINIKLQDLGLLKAPMIRFDTIGALIKPGMPSFRICITRIEGGGDVQTIEVFADKDFMDTDNALTEATFPAPCLFIVRQQPKSIAQLVDMLVCYQDRIQKPAALVVGTGGRQCVVIKDTCDANAVLYYLLPSFDGLEK